MWKRGCVWSMEGSVGDKVEELMVHGNKWKMARALPRSRSGDQETSALVYIWLCVLKQVSGSSEYLS